LLEGSYLIYLFDLCPQLVDFVKLISLSILQDEAKNNFKTNLLVRGELKEQRGLDVEEGFLLVPQA